MKKSIYFILISFTAALSWSCSSTSGLSSKSQGEYDDLYFSSKDRTSTKIAANNNTSGGADYVDPSDARISNIQYGNTKQANNNDPVIEFDNTNVNPDYAQQLQEENESAAYYNPNYSNNGYFQNDYNTASFSSNPNGFNNFNNSPQIGFNVGFGNAFSPFGWNPYRRNGFFWRNSFGWNDPWGWGNGFNDPFYNPYRGGFWGNSYAWNNPYWCPNPSTVVFVNNNNNNGSQITESNTSPTRYTGPRYAAGQQGSTVVVNQPARTRQRNNRIILAENQENDPGKSVNNNANNRYSKTTRTRNSYRNNNTSRTNSNVNSNSRTNVNRTRSNNTGIRSNNNSSFNNRTFSNTRTRSNSNNRFNSGRTNTNSRSRSFSTPSRSRSSSGVNRSRSTSSPSRSRSSSSSGVRKRN